MYPLLVVGCGISDTKPSSEFLSGENGDGDVSDDNVELSAVPLLSMELFSSGVHSRSSSKMPSSMESRVMGIIVSTDIFRYGNIFTISSSIFTHFEI